MRPYRRTHHSTWRTRRINNMIGEVQEYLKPFVHSTRSLWQLEPPFPLTAKIFVTFAIWFLLFLPLCYFLVPPLAIFFLFNYFSEIFNLDDILTKLAEVCARSSWPKKVVFPFEFLSKLTIAFFLYDYYQILRRIGTD